MDTSLMHHLWFATPPFDTHPWGKASSAAADHERIHFIAHTYILVAIVVDRVEDARR